MQFDGSLMVPTLRRTGQVVAGMPSTVLAALVLHAALGMLSDLGIARSPGFSIGVLLFIGMAQVFVQVWVARDALVYFGYRPAMPIAGALSLYLQSLLIGAGILLGLILLVLPAFYVAARWYLAGTILILHGSGRRAAMQQSWDLLESRWASALGVMFLLMVPMLAPLLVMFYPLPFISDHGFASLFAVNLVAAVGIVGGYLASVALLSLVQPANTELREVFS